MKEKVKISDYLFFQEGPGVRNTQYTTSGVKLLNVSNLVDGEIDLSNSDRYISNEEAHGKYKHFLVDEGDLIIASSGIKVDYLDKKVGFIKKEHLPLCMNTSTIRFKALDSKALNIKYFKYYLQSNDFKYQVSKSITGSAQLNYGPSHLKQMTFILYDLDEQNKIVERLDKINNIIQKHKKVMNFLDTLIKARFVEMFGDVSRNTKGFPLKYLNELSSIGSSKRIYANEYVDSGIPFYRSKEIRELEQGKKPAIELYIKEERYTEIKNKFDVPKKGDILIAAIGTTIGHMWTINSNQPFYYKDGNLILVSLKGNVDSIFLNFALKILIDDFKNKGTAGSAQLALTIEKLEKMQIVYPPIELQNQFATFVKQVDKLKLDVQKSLEKTQMLFDSLMQEYFE